MPAGHGSKIYSTSTLLTSPPVPLSILWRGVHPEGIHPEGEIGGEVAQ